jgi:hypothetical protein
MGKESTMRLCEEIKKGLGEITEISLLLIALGIVAQILFGQAAAFPGGIVANLTELLSTLGESGLTGLLAVGIILFLFNRQRPQLVAAATDTEPTLHPAPTRLTSPKPIEPVGDKPTIASPQGVLRTKADRSEHRPTRSTGLGQAWPSSQANQKPPRRGRNM